LWIFRFAKDVFTVQSFLDVLSALRVGMLMIPVSAGLSFSDCEDVVVFLARANRVERTSIGNSGDMKLMPMNRGGLAQLVRKMNDDVIAFANVERRSGDLPVIGEDVSRNSRPQRNLRGLGGEIYFD